MSADGAAAATPAVIVPAHNEEAVVGRLLRGLIASSPRGGIDVIVACNGCTDDTALIAGGFGPPVRIVEIDEASKQAALRAGNEAATGFPRLYIDADIEISRASIDALVAAVGEPGVLAAAPTRVLDRTAASRIVRAYYDVWERLPSTQSGLFGRGVIAVAEAGYERIADLPPMMGDDLVISESFAADERCVVRAATSTIRIPRTACDLLRRRVRAATGNMQADASAMRASESRLSAREFAKLLRAEPRLIPRAPVFVGFTVIARLSARRVVRRRDFDTWRRDDSSRR